MLGAEWARTEPFDLHLLSPSILGSDAPTAHDIVSFNERRYAAFCDAFQAACTREVLRHDPRQAAVLVNDISEGPDFERVAQAGFRIVTIYHVDVVAYIASIYLRGWIAPETLTRWWERLRTGPAGRAAPAILRLIFEQQRASLRWSERVVVPSAEMKSILLRCYPSTPPERVEVLPWGSNSVPRPDELAAARTGAEGLRREYGIEPDAHVLLCLSRISPEKGQDFLLETLLEWEAEPSFPQRPVWLFICGAAAFMNGQAHERRLRQLAARLKRVRVIFPGYVAGERKRAFLALAHLYLFPSSHESYGLTLVEALSAGLPAICRDHSGARQVMTPELGAVVPGAGRTARQGFREAIARLLANPTEREAMSQAALDWARRRPFSQSAARLAALLSGTA
jgi:glycosyltransferase involved in cell wall biosynthesis